MANIKQKEPAADLTGWPTQGEVVETLRISERTLNRMVEQGKIQRQYRQMQGRRPVPVFHPGDIETLASRNEADKSFLVHQSGPKQLAVIPQGQYSSPFGSESALDALPVLAEAIATITGARAKARPTYVKIEEAEEISGLPRALLLEKVEGGELKGFKRGRWYFQTKGLERL